MNPLQQFVNSLSTKSKTQPMAMPYAPSKNMSVAPKTTTPNMSKVPTSNPAATTPIKKPVIQPVTSTITKLPKEEYINTLSTTPTQNAYDTVTGARTVYGASQGLPDMMGGKPVTTPTITPAPKPKTPYDDYMDFLNSEKVKTLETTQENLAKRTSEELLRTRAREDELRKNEIGQLERGQNYQLGEEQRLSNKSLADLAIASGANMETLNRILAQGKEKYNLQAEQEKPIEVGGQLYQKQADGSYVSVAGGAGAEGFTLGKDQVRYDAQGNVIAGNLGGGTGGGTYIAGADPTVDSWVKWVQTGGDITKVPDAYQNQVVQATAGTPKAQSEISKQAVTTIGDLLANPAFNSIFGPIDQFLGGTLGPQAILAKNTYNQLKGLLSLDNIKYLKGTGAISDAEQKLLANAATSLSRGLYGDQARTVLTKLRDDLTKVKTETPTQSTIGSGGLYDF